MVRGHGLRGRMLVVGRSCFGERCRRRVPSVVGGLLLRSRRVCRLFRVSELVLLGMRWRAVNMLGLCCGSGYGHALSDRGMGAHLPVSAARSFNSWTCLSSSRIRCCTSEGSRQSPLPLQAGHISVVETFVIAVGDPTRVVVVSVVVADMTTWGDYPDFQTNE